MNKLEQMFYDALSEHMFATSYRATVAKSMAKVCEEEIRKAVDATQGYYTDVEHVSGENIDDYMKSTYNIEPN
jgi:hypothetical protein